VVNSHARGREPEITLRVLARCAPAPFACGACDQHHKVDVCRKNLPDQPGEALRRRASFPDHIADIGIDQNLPIPRAIEIPVAPLSQLRLCFEINQPALA
jgi:hypothetical protein